MRNGPEDLTRIGGISETGAHNSSSIQDYSHNFPTQTYHEQRSSPTLTSERERPKKFGNQLTDPQLRANNSKKYGGLPLPSHQGPIGVDVHLFPPELGAAQSYRQVLGKLGATVKLGADQRNSR